VVEWNSGHPQIRRFNHDYTSKLFCVRHHRPDSKIGCRVPQTGDGKDFTVATDVQVYFCDPQSPWQRGTNENTNLLLRQYFPRGTDLSGYSQAQLDRVSLRLNQRPRKTLGFETPASKLQASVASTV
jgi:hypothetical protein